RARGRRPDRPPAPTDLLSHFLLAVVRFQLRPTAGRAQQSLAQLLGVGARHAHREARPLFVLGLELHVTAFEDPTNGPRIVVVDGEAEPFVRALFDGSGVVERELHRPTVGAREPADAEVRPAVVARDDRRDVLDFLAFHDRQRGFAGRPAGLAVVARVLP